ncbi:MAG TPA: SMI1/KNR4 family protein [Pyrinomonadaceae bacterium]|jgi:hypothetical protein|nr:SMI1/KNR4 family protein [Pyrinomonadaceae bacterium]
MGEDWRGLIVTMLFVKQELLRLDAGGLWPHHHPEVAAGEARLAAVEARLGHALDAKHRDFLSYADGWRGFYQTVDLFGTAQLAGGGLMGYAAELLGAVDEGVLKSSGFSREELLPIAATPADKDLFVMTRPYSASPGVVIWLAGEEVDRFHDFEDYFRAMLDYNRMEVENLKAESAPPG